MVLSCVVNFDLELIFIDFGVDSGDISRIFLRFWSHFEVILCNSEALGALGCSWGGLEGSWGSLGRPWGGQGDI